MSKQVWKSDTELCELFGNEWCATIPRVLIGSPSADAFNIDIANEWLEQHRFKAKVFAIHENESSGECDWLIELNNPIELTGEEIEVLARLGDILHKIEFMSSPDKDILYKLNERCVQRED